MDPFHPPEIRWGWGEVAMRLCRKSGSATNNIAANTSQTSSIAHIHQNCASVNRLHISARQTIQNPLAPASNTQMRACHAKPFSMWSKADSRSDATISADRGHDDSRNEGDAADPHQHGDDMDNPGNSKVIYHESVTLDAIDYHQ
ncbi:MAG: hypothetical protein IPP45_15270 [Sphingomonadales bacterium]|nr:hypothetical protein [Sphingomonadales bacterium]